MKKCLLNTGDYEKELLKTIFEHPKSINEVYEFLKPEDFIEEKNGEMYKKICDSYFENDREFNLVEFGIANHDLLNNTIYDYILESNDWYSPLFVLQYAEGILREKTQQVLLKSAQNIIQDTKSYKDEPIQVASYYSSVLASIEERKKERTDIKEVFQDLKAEIIQNKNRNLLGMPTGIRLLDIYTEGLIKKTVMSISAYTNVGKSAFTYWILSNLLKQGYKGLFFSLEVSKTTVLNRLISCVSGIDYKDTEKGKICISEQTMKQINNFKLNIYENKDTMNDIKKTVIKEAPDFIIIDFIQNVDTGKHKDEYTQMSTLAVETQKLAIKYNIGIISLSQISNSGALANKDNKIIYSKGSGALGASADVVLELRRDDKVMNINIKKNKFGERGEFNLDVNFANNQFSEPLTTYPNYH